MPLARIEIEQIEGSRWIAEVEAGGRPGGPAFRRIPRVVKSSFEEIMAEVARLYYQQVPPPVEPPPIIAQQVLDAEVEFAAEEPKRRGRPRKVDGDTVVG